MEATTPHEILNDLQDLAKSNAQNVLRDFVYNALGHADVLDTTEPETLTVIFRITNLLEQAKQLKTQELCPK